MQSLNRWIYGKINRLFLNGCSDYNTLQVRKNSRTKLQARKSFKENSVPHAEGTLFYNPRQAIRFVKKHGFPVVIKPNVSGYSRGSHFPIQNYKELWKAALLVKIWWPGSIIEKYLEGKNYRVVVVKNEIMSVIQRYPPFVTGDGNSTILKLIENENKSRQDLNLFPVMHPIAVNRRTRNFLKKSNLKLSSVIRSEERAYLYNKVALAPGGIVETIDKKLISSKNREIFLKILKSFDAEIFGIDVIFEKGIEFDYDQQDCIFLELNSRPFLKMHDFPRYGHKPKLERYYHHLNQIKLSDSGVF